jgi:SAM-dependent methyltransferase
VHTYLKSPLYRVSPLAGSACVAVQHLDRVGEFTARFLGVCRRPVALNLHFHHFSYVRKDLNDIYYKFKTTESQDGASHPDWLTTKWAALPWGTNLHMSVGYEKCWKEIEILTLDQLPNSVYAIDWVRQIAEDEDSAWRDRTIQIPPTATINTQPCWDERFYAHRIAQIAGSTKALDVIKTTCLEFLILNHLASCCQGPILELGCGHGGSTLALAKGNNQVDAVDPFLPYDEESWDHTNYGVTEGDETKFLSTLKTFRIEEQVNLLKYPTELVGPYIGMYGLVFVDANHSYVNCKFDIELAWRHLNPGGLLVCHDYSTHFPGVLKAVDEIPQDWKVFAGTTLAYVRKS